MLIEFSIIFSYKFFVVNSSTFSRLNFEKSTISIGFLINNLFSANFVLVPNFFKEEELNLLNFELLLII